jgi:hypothetical protein
VQRSGLKALTEQVQAYAEYAPHLSATTGQVHKFRLHFHHFPRQGDTSNLLLRLRRLLDDYADVLEVIGAALP